MGEENKNEEPIVAPSGGQEDDFSGLDMSAFEMFNETPAELTDEQKAAAEQNIKTGEPEKAESVAGQGQNEDEDKSEQGSPNLYSSFASALKEDGLFASVDLENTKIEDAQGLITAVKAEIKASEFSNLNDTQKEYLTALDAGVPLEDYKEAKSVEAQLTSITPEQLETEPELRKAVLVQNYMDDGLTEAKANQFAELHVANDTDKEEAKLALPLIQARSTQRIQDQIKAGQDQITDQENKITAFKADVQKSVDDAVEIIEGMVLNEEVKRAVKASILTPSHQLPDGTKINKITQDRLKDPVAFDVKMHYMYHITRGFTDFTALKAKAKSSAINELDSLIKGQTFVPGDSKANLEQMIDVGDSFDFLDAGSEIGL